MASTLKRPIASIVGLVFALGWPLLFLIIPSQQHQNLTNLAQDRGVLMFEWAAVAMLAAIVVFWERLAFFTSVGFRRLKLADILCIAWLVLLAGTFAWLLSAKHADFSGTIVAIYAAIPFALRLGLVFTAGICEEICFRGYVIERLSAFTGKPWLAALASVAFFTLGHVGRYGFTPALGAVAFTGAALAALYLWRRNIWPCIALHWFIDGTQILIATAFVAHPH